MDIKKILLFIGLLFIISCQEPIKSVIVDNPSEEKISVEIEGYKTLNINPKESKSIDIKFGKNKIIINNASPEEIYLDKDHEYLINPLKATYYIERVKYFTSKRARERYFSEYSPDKSIVEGIEVNGDYEKLEGKLLIVKRWEFGLDKEMSQSVRLNSSPSKGYVTAVKIHRKIDLEEKISTSIMKILDDALLNHKDKAEE